MIARRARAYTRRARARAAAVVAAAVAAVAVVAVLVVVAGCRQVGREGDTVLHFWGLGREGEVVAELIRDFERENPGIRVEVQQIPWTAAHEKLLTAFVGRSTPDLSQLGNTWIPEFVALRALAPLTPWIEKSATVRPDHYFPGIWSTNVVNGTAYGKDILARAGYPAMPATWTEWRRAMEATKRLLGEDRYAVFLPLNEWAQPVILGLQNGSPLLKDEWTRGAFAEPAFRDAFEFYLDLFRDGLAPPVGNNEIANVYQEFERGYFAMYVTGPWNLGEFKRRLPPEMQGKWATAPFPGPDATHPGVSLAGGSSLVLFANSPHKEAAWKLIEFLSAPAQELRFYALTGDLPAQIAAWEDSALTSDPNIRAFRDQLVHVVPTPMIPEWEQIAMRVQERAEMAARGAVPADSALAFLDRDVERILEKRRWLLAKARESGESTP
jgi:multiple sugar transport system substrate-binding protein